MSVFTTKVSDQKVTVVAANVAYVGDNAGKAVIHFVNGDSLQTDVGYDSVRRNVANALASSATGAETE